MTQRLSIRAAVSIFMIAGVAAYLVPVTTEKVSQDTDPIAATFERELNHEPGPATRIRRESVERDELYEALNQVHWTQGAPNTAAEPAHPVTTEGDTNDEADD